MRGQRCAGRRHGGRGLTCSADRLLRGWPPCRPSRRLRPYPTLRGCGRVGGSVSARTLLRRTRLPLQSCSASRLCQRRAGRRPPRPSTRRAGGQLQTHRMGPGGVVSAPPLCAPPTAREASALQPPFRHVLLAHCVARLFLTRREEGLDVRDTDPLRVAWSAGFPLVPSRPAFLQCGRAGHKHGTR